jgi:hypothetical protein
MTDSNPSPNDDRNPKPRLDDGAGMRIAMRAANPGSGAFGNSSMGFGTGRDPSTHIHVNRPGRLTDRELADLYQDGMVQKIVDAFPVECADTWMRYTFTRQTNYRGYGVDGGAIEDYLDNRVEPSDLDDELSLSSIKALFREQSINARIFRSAYILIGVDDGRDFREPIDAGNIRSIQYLEPLYHTDLHPDKRGAYQLSRGRTDDRAMPFNGKIHPSRIIHFSGKAKPRYLRSLETEEDYSVIDGVFKALSRASQSLDALTYYIQTASVFDYGLDGFSDIRDSEDEDAIAQRMQSVMFALSALRVFIRDSKRESMSTVTRNFGGVGDAIDRITDSICFYTDIPRHILFGTSNKKGLGNVGQEGTEERQWDDLKIAWRSRHWSNPYLYLGKLACLAKDSPTGGRLPKGLGVEIPSGLKRSETDKLANMKTYAEAAKILIGIGALHEVEVRQAFAGDEPNFNLVLDDRISEQLNDAVDDLEMMEAEIVEDDEQALLEGNTDALDSNSPTNPELWARCVAKAKRKFDVYPSAYANSYAAKEYKRMGGGWRSDDRADDLREWHKQKWVNIATGKECGEGDTDGKGKPKCLPKSKAAGLSEAEKKKLVARKRRKDPDANRKGKPINVSSSLDEDDRLDDSEDDWFRGDDGYLVYFGGRRTPVAVSASSRSEAISKARKLKKRGGDNVVSARKPTASEKKTAANGGWIRTGANGEAAGKSKLRGYGPKPGIRKDEDELLADAEWDAIAVVNETAIDEALGDI